MTHQLSRIVGVLTAFWLMLSSMPAAADCSIQQISPAACNLPSAWLSLESTLNALGPTSSSCEYDAKSTATQQSCRYYNGGTEVTKIVSQTATERIINQTTTNAPTYRCASVNGSANFADMVMIENESGTSVSQIANGSLGQTHQTMSGTGRFTTTGESYTMSYDMMLDSSGLPVSGTLTMNGASMDVASLNACGYFSDLGSTPSTPSTYTLTTSKSGTGGTLTSNPAGITCGSDCSESYASGTKVTLTATSSSGATFSGWSGACSGTATTCTVTMDAAQTVKATFVAQNPSDCVFDWAERDFPQYFAPAKATSAYYQNYYYRYYATTGVYLATNDNVLWALGPPTNNALLSLGPMSHFLQAAGCPQ
jgi:hypothetical protein